MNVMVLSTGEDDDVDTVVHVKNAKSKRHALACAVEHRSGGGEFNMALVLLYGGLAEPEDGEPTDETDGADRPEPPADDSTDWFCPLLPWHGRAWQLIRSHGRRS